jgi:acid phosphatase (class A)
MNSLILKLGIAGAVCAAVCTAQTQRKAIFVSPEQLNIAAILPAPPTNGSWQTLAELAELHRIEATRTAEQVAHAQHDDVEESIFIYDSVLGPSFKRGALPLTAILSDHVKNDEGVIVGPAKSFFKRPRPYHLDATLKPVCKTTENRADFGYPSGHGTTGYLEALVLVQMIPEKRDAIMSRADDYAHSREVCGAHYASDEVASRMTAYAMMGLMMNNPQFQTELSAAKKELRAALGF